MGKFREELETFFHECFYCNKTLSKDRHTHVEHVIPFDYIAEDNIWNLTLSCQQCNCQKLGSLPPKGYLYKLLDRNKRYIDKIPSLKTSLNILGTRTGAVNKPGSMTYAEKIIKNHYENALSHGYQVINIKDITLRVKIAQ